MKPYHTIASWLTPRRRKLLARYWLAINLAYDAFRAWVVQLLFGKHGVNGWLYLVFVLIFSALFSVCSVRLVLALVDKNRRSIARYAPLTILTFFAPDIYIVLRSRNVSGWLYAALGIYVLMTSTITAISLRQDSQKHRSA